MIFYQKNFPAPRFHLCHRGRFGAIVAFDRTGEGRKCNRESRTLIQSFTLPGKFSSQEFDQHA